VSCVGDPLKRNVGLLSSDNAACKEVSMFEEFSRFFYVVLGLTAAVAIVRIVYYFRSRHDPSISDFEKSFRHFMFSSGYYAALVFTSVLYLPTVGIYPSINVQKVSTEVVLQQLIGNQERMGKQLEQIRDIVSFVLLMTAIYLVSFVSILRQLQNERRRSLSQNTGKTRPLGLELD